MVQKLEQKKEDLEHIIIGTFVNNGKRQRVLRIRICNLFCVRYAIYVCTILYMYSIIYIRYTYIITNCTYIYLYICAIIVCKEIVLKKAALRIGCPAILWIFYSAGILLNLDFAMRMTQRH